MTFIPSSDLVAGVLDGKRRAIARLMTRAEAGSDECRDALAQVYTHAGRAHVVGITGVPGSGKSTLVHALARAAGNGGRRVGVVAIDPSSPFSGGSILGDRIRMNDLAGDPGIFIRSMATRGSLGGLARASFDAVDLLDAGGYDLVLIETVGVGQDEVDVVQAAHTTVVVSAPGLGDDIQAIKAGILEIADIHVVSKADRPDANRTIAELKSMLTMGLKPGTRWTVPVLGTSAQTGEGIETLLDAIDSHGQHLVESDEIAGRRRRIATMRMMKTAEDIIRKRFAERERTEIAALLDQVAARTLDPHRAAVKVLDTIHDKGEKPHG